MAGAKKSTNGNTPIFALVSIGIFSVSVVVLITTGHSDHASTFIAVVVSTIPSLVAALFAERSSRDIRNGVVEERARRGANAAISENNLISADGPVMKGALESHAVALDALTTVLQQIHDNQNQNKEGTS